VRINAARLRHEILELAQEGRRVVLLGHSKGAVDAAASLSLFPELTDFVAGLVSMQGPHGGSAVAHDLSNTNVQKTVVLGAIEKLLRGCRHAVLDCSYEARQEFLRRHPYPIERIPTLCVATYDSKQSSLIRPMIEYVAVRYGEVCDGLVCRTDAVLPHSARVILADMDHFGPAWPSFPATDPYDPTRLWLVTISMALRFGSAAARHASHLEAHAHAHVHAHAHAAHLETSQASHLASHPHPHPHPHPHSHSHPHPRPHASHLDPSHLALLDDAKRGLVTGTQTEAQTEARTEAWAEAWMEAGVGARGCRHAAAGSSSAGQ